MYDYTTNIKLGGKFVSDIAAIGGEYLITSSDLEFTPDWSLEKLQHTIGAHLVVSFDDYTEANIRLTGVTLKGHTIYLKGEAA